MGHKNTEERVATLEQEVRELRARLDGVPLAMVRPLPQLSAEDQRLVAALVGVDPRTVEKEIAGVPGYGVKREKVRQAVLDFAAGELHAPELTAEEFAELDGRAGRHACALALVLKDRPRRASTPTALESARTTLAEAQAAGRDTHSAYQQLTYASAHRDADEAMEANLVRRKIDEILLAIES